MKLKSYFLVCFFAIIFLLGLGFVLGEVCDSPEIPDYTRGEFCNPVTMEWGALKLDGEECFNNYECWNFSCIEGICQEEYEHIIPEKIVEQGTEEGFLSKIGNFILGIFGIGGDSGSGSSSGSSSGGGSGSSCTPRWVCSQWSIPSKNCGIRTCKDTNSCRSSYNSATRNYNKTESKACSPTSTDEDIIVLPDDSDEDDYYFDEEDEKSYTWLWVLIIFLLLLGIGLIIFLIVRNRKNMRKIESTGRATPNLPRKSPPGTGLPAGVAGKRTSIVPPTTRTSNLNPTKANAMNNIQATRQELRSKSI